MPAKPPIVIADDNKTPTTAVQNPTTENWHQPVGAEDGTIATMGAMDDAAVTNPTLSASEIALLKGLMKQLQGTGTGAAPVSITGSNFTIRSAPVMGAKTVTASAASIFAGVSRRIPRYAMVIYNESSNTVYWGPAGVTTANGYPILPGDHQVITFDPSVDTPIYAVAAANSAVRVVELA